MVFQLAVLTVISELYRARIAGAMNKSVTHHILTSFFFIRACVPRVPNPINYMFTMHLHLSDGKRLSLQQETRPYDSGFPLGCCNSAISNLMERDPNCKYAAEKEIFFSICDSIGNSTWGHGWSWWYCYMDDSMQRKVLICRASW